MRKRQSGFSFIELMVVIAILVTVMGTVFQQVNRIQRGARNEEQNLDVLQQGRELLDEFARDLHQAGYPSAKLYQPGTIAGSINQAQQVAVGLVAISNNPPQIIFEGDVDGSGTVSSVRYRLVTASAESTRCPCVERSQVQKVTADPLTGQGTSFHVAVEYAASNGLTFTAYDGSGNVVAIPSGGLDINNNTATIQSSRSIGVNLSIKSIYVDLQTKKAPTISMTTLAQIRN
jgi:prepilin-type N-terminal cleavage/methylation domain-containing protein